MYIEGPFRMFLGRKDVVHYFILRADLPKNRRRRQLQHPDSKTFSNLKKYIIFHLQLSAVIFSVYRF